MASTSGSSIQNSFKYDVFISFRGEDTRKNFVDHLYHALTQKGIETYKDDEKIKQGKMISDELIKAIEDSKLYIIVFSKNYASSSWCLEELVKIMECQTMDKHTAYPVFYDVEPTEVRKQTGAVGDAFEKHKDKKAARKWREAMKEASDLAGFELKSIANGHEAKFIQEIVKKISVELSFINSSSDGDLIGMVTRVEEVLSSLEPGVGDVRMIGISGMGGAGKTTLARAIFDQISIQFEGESFIENVREVSKGSLAGLKELQKQVLSDVLMDQNIKVSSVSSGKRMMQKIMRGRKVLVVLDDVDHKDQLEALAGDRNWFKPGSKIIITTRDEQVLVAHRVSLIHNVTLLSQAEAGCLFSRYAFGREIPTQGYEELSGQVVQYAHGLPLTIKVLGSFLCGQSEPYWVDAIERLKNIPLKETMERLEISFDGLEDDYKEIFLDVACILKGWNKEDAIRVLESRGFHAEVGLRVLEQKSLITISESRYLGMHDHLEEMGRNIVRRSHPDEPQRHSRLWIGKEIEYILNNDLGTQATKCLHLYSEDLSAEIAIKGLAKMKDLRFIHIILLKDYLKSNIVQFDKVSEYLPNSLRFMRWSGCPFPSLPNTFQGENLVGLVIRGSKIVQLWEDGEEKVLHKLRFLTFYSSCLQTFDLRVAPNLEQLTIYKCYDFVELHMPAHHLNLEYLTLTASKLTNLHLENTPNLKTLILESCNDLVEIQMPVESPKLKVVDLSHSKLTNLHLGNTPNLKKLKLSHSKLKTLQLRSTQNFEALILEGCNDLVELQMPAESLKLEFLDLKNSKLTSLQLGNTPNIVKLELYGITIDQLWEDGEEKVLHKLRFLNIRYSKLKTFDLRLAPNLEHLYLTHSKLTNLHLGNTPNLKKLKLSRSKMTNLHLGNTPNLKKLKLSHSKLKTIHLGNTPNLEKLILEGCKLQMPAESQKLEYLDLKNSKMENLHLGNTPNLKTLILEGCNDLVEFQMPQSLKLAHLDLSHSKLTNLHLGSTPNLEMLILKSCNDLVELQMPAESLKLECLDLTGSKLKNIHLGNTPNLEMLVLEVCNDLVELKMPDSLKLKYLDLNHSKLKTLHLGNTPNLERLRLKGCNDLVELEMPYECLKLEELYLYHSKLKTLHLRSTPNLETLVIECCNDLVELKMPDENLKLECLDLSHSKLKTLHLGNTPNLERLRLKFCNDLVELQMPSECLELSSINLSHSKLRTLDLRLTPNLKSLNLENCYDLVEINAPVGYLKKLYFLDLSCGKFKSFVFDKWSQPAEAGSLSELHLIAEPTDVCLLHPDNSFPKYRFECYYKEDPASSFGNLEMLISMGLCACTNLENFSRRICSLRGLRKLTLKGSIPEVPRDLDQLECLEELIFSSTNIRNLPDSICMLMHLKAIKLQSCWYLEKLPEDLGRLQCLEELDLTECIVLRDIPNSICQMKSLKYFHLPYCFLVEKLPEEIGSLKRLEELHIESTGISHLPQSIFQLKRLRIVGFTWQLQSYGFRTLIQTSTYVSFAYTCYHSSANHLEKPV